MKTFVVFVIAVFTGCHANVMWQDQPEQPTLQMIRNSELGQEINDRISKSTNAINKYTLAIQSQVTLTRDLLAKLSQEADQLKLHLEQEMTSMQSQLKSLMEMGPQTEELKQKLDQHFLDFQMSMSPLVQSFQSQLAQRSQELQKNLALYSEELSKLDPYAQDLKAQLTALWESFAKNKQS
uniref:Apolipoprotein A-IV a n=1 Tax=Sinocyclocheilus grahami TaxID=75366 RepID=A0A672PM22_SINGR